MIRRITLHLLASLMLLALPSLAHAQSAFQPKSAVKFIMPFPAGGINDLLVRIAADKLHWNGKIGKIRY